MYSPTDTGEATALQKVNVVDASKMSPAQTVRRSGAPTERRLDPGLGAAAAGLSPEVKKVPTPYRCRRLRWSSMAPPTPRGLADDDGHPSCWEVQDPNPRLGPFQRAP